MSQPAEAFADPYPTRLCQPRGFTRRAEPVVHARSDRRWDGPLDEVGVSGHEAGDRARSGQNSSASRR